MNRTDRLLAMVLELQGRDRVTATELARTFEVTKRTIYRDIATLNESGVPVVSMAGQGYWLMEGYFLPPVSLSPEEAIMLTLGSQAMAHSFDAQYRAAAQSGARKIEAVLNEVVAEEVAYLKDNIRFIQAAGAADTSELLQLARRAILERRCLRLHYAKRVASEQELSERTVNPHGLVHFNDTWMLSAFCQLREDMRVFRLNRIQGVNLLDETFARQKDFSVHHLQRLQADPITIELLFQPGMTPWVKERSAYFVRAYKETPAGLQVTLQVGRFDEAFAWILGWGSSVIVLSPESFKKRVKQELEATLKAY